MSYHKGASDWMLDRTARSIAKRLLARVNFWNNDAGATEQEVRAVLVRVQALVLAAMKTQNRIPPPEAPTVEAIKPRLRPRESWAPNPLPTPSAELSRAFREVIEDLRSLAVPLSVERLCAAVRARGGHMNHDRLRGLAREALEDAGAVPARLRASASAEPIG